MKREFEFEKVIDAEGIITYLEDLVEAFKSGVVNLTTSHGDFILKPAGLIFMEVEATSKKDKEKFEIKFSWKKEEALLEEMNQEFAISAEEPISDEEIEEACIEDDETINNEEHAVQEAKAIEEVEPENAETAEAFETETLEEGEPKHHRRK